MNDEQIEESQDDIKALVELMREDRVFRQAQLGYTIAGIILMGVLLFLIWLKI